MIRVLCYNIHGGFDRYGKRDLRRLNFLLDEYNIDIAVFQEFETRSSRGGTLNDIDIVSGMNRPYHLKGLAMVEGEGWYGNLIVSRYPIIKRSVHDLETSPSREPRNAVDVVIETPRGKNLRIIGTHLSLSPWERWSEVRNLISLIHKVEISEKSPLLLMGDINEWRPTSKLLRYLDDHMQQITLDKTFPAIFPLFKLDRLWYDNLSPDVIRAHVLNTETAKYLSDHLPILVEINI